MSHIEYELRVLEINKEEIQEKFKKINAVLIENVLQKRYVTIKDIKSSNIDGTNETEIEVSDFATTNEILKELGYIPRGIQENKRIKYDLNGVEVDIDTWPKIPTYLEIEGKSEDEVYNTLKLLNIPKENATALDVKRIYREVYGIDLNKEPILLFGENEK